MRVAEQAAPLALECAAALLFSYAAWTFLRPRWGSRKGLVAAQGYGGNSGACCIQGEGAGWTCCGGGADHELADEGKGGEIRNVGAAVAKIVTLRETQAVGLGRNSPSACGSSCQQAGEQGNCGPAGCGALKISISSNEPGEMSWRVQNWRTSGVSAKIFYASETGTSRRLAENLGAMMRMAGLQVQVVDPANYEPEDLPKEQMVILVTSTWQDGKPPTHAAFFHRWLEESATDFRVGSGLLKGLRYGVFGIGSGAYGDSYNVVARSTDQHFAALGANRVVSLGEGNVDEHVVEEVFQQWAEVLVNILLEGERHGTVDNGDSGVVLENGHAENGGSFGRQGGGLGVTEENKAAFSGRRLLNGAETESSTFDGTSGYESDSEDEEETQLSSDLVDVEDVAGKVLIGENWDFTGDDHYDTGNGYMNGLRQNGSGGSAEGLVEADDRKGRNGVKKKWFVRKPKAKSEIPQGGRNSLNGKGKSGLDAMTGLKGEGGPREMVTPVIRANLEKQGYKVLGTHSGVKLCRWTKSQLRGRGGCYKHSFYGIESHRCMEATPSLACANKCVFCWRHHTNPVGKSWRWQVDPPEAIVDAALDQHTRMIWQMKGVPGVKPERLEEGMSPRHCALSLVGEPIMYPHINGLVNLLHNRRISTFLVTNAQFPERIAELSPITQLYVSVDAATRESLKAIDRPLFSDFWERFTASLSALRDKRQRTVYRLTLVKGWNMEEVKSYCELLQLGSPDFIEIKGVTYCGSSAASSLTMENVPWHSDVKAFGEVIQEATGGEYELACEHAHSCCILLAKAAKFKRDGQWHTWIDYERFQDLVAEGKPFGSEDYLARTPEWAVYGADEAGFDPQETRVRKERRHGSPADSGGCT